MSTIRDSISIMEKVNSLTKSSCIKMSVERSKHMLAFLKAAKGDSGLIRDLEESIAEYVTHGPL